MALSATIYKFDLDISDLDRNIYDHASLHVALHPSETPERMIMRVLAYALNYHEHLSFTKGLSTDSEPDIWQKNYSDEIELWIELGLPDDKRLKKACNQSQEVKLYTYGGQGVDTWWDQLAPHAYKFEKLAIYRIALEPVEALASVLERGMNFSCMIQDEQITLSWDEQMLEFPIHKLHPTS